MTQIDPGDAPIALEKSEDISRLAKILSEEG